MEECDKVWLSVDSTIQKPVPTYHDVHNHLDKAIKTGQVSSILDFLHMQGARGEDQVGLERSNNKGPTALMHAAKAK